MHSRTIQLIKRPFLMATIAGVYRIEYRKIVHNGKQPINAQAEYNNYVVSPDNGPDWQLRLQLNLLYPKK